MILNIDVSGRKGLVALAKDGIEVESRTNTDPMEHASFLQPAIQDLLLTTTFSIKDLDAIALANGPGSYTGLRVGLASAKGLCYALSIPLLTINSLQIMAYAAQLVWEMKLPNADNEPELNRISNMFGEPGGITGNAYYCPMIDARRMEIFYGVYDAANGAFILPKNEILSPSFLENFLERSQILFTGNGIEKWKKICEHPNALFMDQPELNKAISKLSAKLYSNEIFADLSTVEPDYCKPFYNAGGHRTLQE